MGAEKHVSKVAGGYVGGFLQLFDWNGKSRKKLSFNKSDMPESTKQGKKSDEKLPTTRILLIDEDESQEISSVKGYSHYFCAAASTEECNGNRAPSVVARLMGLDSLPTSFAVETHGTPLFRPQSLHGTAHHPKKMSKNRGHQIADDKPSLAGVSRQKIAESRPLNASNRPIERFQCEILPPKSAKSHTIAHPKLLSPIKSPGFISPKNAADAMEATAKILEPGSESVNERNCFPAPSVPMKSRDLKERFKASQRSPRLSDVSKRHVGSNAIKLLKGQSLNKSWNGSDDTSGIQASPHWEKTHEVSSKNKGKSISLALQAKVNVQRREGLGPINKRSLVRKDEDECKSSILSMNQTVDSKSRQNKLNTASASSVLWQNNQKQNCPSNKDRLSSKLSVSNHVGRKVASGDGAFGRSKTLNKVSRSSRAGKKDGSEMIDEKDVSSFGTKKFLQKKRATDGELCSKKSVFNDTVLVKGDEKSFCTDVLTNKRINQSEDSRSNGMDVISFTFTSPMIKPNTLSCSGDTTKHNKDVCFTQSSCSETSTAPANRRSSSVGLNVIGGDVLNILLDQKLRELTFGIDPSSCFNPCKAVHDASLPGFIGTTPIETHGKTYLQHVKDLLGDFGMESSLLNSQVLNMNHTFQGMAKCRQSIGDASMDQDCLHPSPLSIFESSLSNGSCNTSESCKSTNGYRLCSSGLAKSLSGATCQSKILSLDDETALSDSACSTFEGTMNMEHTDCFWALQRADKMILEYVKKIIQGASLTFKDLLLCNASEVIDPCLFERLENQETKPGNEFDRQVYMLRRKELFDCVTELLNTKCRRYGVGSYNTWAQGVVIIQDEGLALEVFKEILLWKSMGDWMVDDLVEKDMSSHLGRWRDFEAEALEVGVEIEGEIFFSLFDELFSDSL